MIDNHHRDGIDEVRFPQFSGDADVVAAVLRSELTPRIFTQSSVCVIPAVSCALMRSPSGERHRKSVTNCIPDPESAKTHGRSLQPLLRDDRAIDGRIELRLRHTVRPHDPRYIDARPRAEAEVQGRRKSPASGRNVRMDFDLPADAEGVDALIAGDGLRPRPRG
jgi:hypothetical protein